MSEALYYPLDFRRAGNEIPAKTAISPDDQRGGART